MRRPPNTAVEDALRRLRGMTFVSWSSGGLAGVTRAVPGHPGRMTIPLAIFTVAVYAAIAAGVQVAIPRVGRSPGGGRRRPVLTLLAVIVIGTVSTVQLTLVPGLLGRLGRNADAIRAGQVWRLLTAVTVQDGGVVGTASNLVTLALIGGLAELLLGRGWWVLAFAAPTLAGELAGLAWQPIGAGNSVAVAGLCGAVAVVVARGQAGIPIAARVPAAISLLLFGWLAAGSHDVHGAAGVAGAVVGLAFLATGHHLPQPANEALVGGSGPEQSGG